MALSRVPQTHYATATGNVHVAYQVLGDGPVDLVFVPAFASNLDVWWELPAAAQFLHRLASFSRLILLDKRGTGLSDRLTRVDPMEERIDDVRAVMDAVGSERAVIFAASEGTPIASLFAATYPQRTVGLVLWGSMAKWSPTVDYPWSLTDEMYTQIVEMATEHWGSGYTADFLMPSRASDPDIRTWFARYERASASPGAFAQLLLTNSLIDVRPILPLIQARTLVLHAATDIFVAVEGGRYVAAHVPQARYVELPGSDHAFFGAASTALADEIEEFVTGMRHPPEPDRVLATILLIDALTTGIEGSVDARPVRERSEVYDDMVAKELERFGGRSIDVSADRGLAAFDGPARAIRCAESIRDLAAALAFDIRAAVHTGEIERMHGTFGGAAIRVASLLKERAQPGEIIVTSTVRDLVAGAGIHFEPRGRHRLPGATAELELVAVSRATETSLKKKRDDQPRARFEAAVERALRADRPAPPLPPLTARQSEVAYLVSFGLSNRAIGTRLFITERTVEDHMQNIFESLDFGSRTQIAAWVAKRT